MNARPAALFFTLFLGACSTYNPLDDSELRTAAARPISGSAVTATFLGNTTILISDGETNLLVDGFVSRPGAIRTLVGRIAPDPNEICRQLSDAGIRERGKLDAVLVGHAHHDHALDAPTIARKTGAFVMGTESYRFIHEGAGAETGPEHLLVVNKDGACKTFGRFTVTFVPSDHVGTHSIFQKWIEGDITEPLKTPAHYSNFKCGDVFAIHIAHPDGKMLVTTTAGARPGKTQHLRADVVFLGVGFLSKEGTVKQDSYWKENVEVLDPDLVIPVHWDNFARKLSKRLKPTSLKFIDDTEEAIKLVQGKAGAENRGVRVLDFGESIVLRRGKIQ